MGAVVYCGPSSADDDSILYQPYAYSEINLERYQPQPIFSYVEYDLTTCTPYSGGSFSLDQQPQYGTVTYGTKAVTITGLYCNGTPANATTIFYTWTAHNNKSDNDVFHGTWTAPDGYYKPQFTGRPTVPIVRPIDETNYFQGFYQRSNGIWGKWWAALKPPKDDPSFDFDGENIREVFVAAQNTCESRAPGALGGEAVSPSGTPATWEVGKLLDENGNNGSGPMNVYGYDFVGWSKCALEAYRCANAATPVCGITLTQRITIHSPADKANAYFDFNPQKTNILVENIGGRIFPGVNPAKLGDGIFQSQRGAESGLQTYPGAFSDISACSGAQLNASSILKHC